MRMGTVAKVLAGLGLFGGAVALISSDNEKVSHFRDNLGKFTGVMAGSAARAMQGNDISYTRDSDWKIEPHKSAAAPTASASSFELPSDWRFMTYTAQTQYLEALKLRQKHEERLKELDVEKAKAEAAAANVVIATVEEKKEEEKKDE